jgi:hypothetical protein
VTTVPGGIDVEVETPLEHLKGPLGLHELERHVRASTPAGACSVEAESPRLLERDLRSLSVVLHFYCPPGPVTLKNGWLLGTEPRSQNVCAIDGEPWVFRPGATERDVGRPKRVFETLTGFVTLGGWHVLSGLDHLLFVLLLLLSAAATGARSLRAKLGSLAALITGFTLGHSLTLLAAALGWVELPGRLVESVIAFSIVLLAASNVLQEKSRTRLLWTSAFGLVHGFGFAAALAESELPRRHVVAALLAFNAGIELAQLALVLLVFPLLFAASRWARYRTRIAVPASLAIGACGLVWFVKRALDLDFLPWLGT